MIAIKDMEMPKSCKECPMSHPVFGDGWETWCSLTKKNVATPNHKCPLAEIVTCKDCKYTRQNDDNDRYCDLSGRYYDSDYFCSNGERRE